MLLSRSSDYAIMRALLREIAPTLHYVKNCIKAATFLAKLNTNLSLLKHFTFLLKLVLNTQLNTSNMKAQQKVILVAYWAIAAVVVLLAPLASAGSSSREHTVSTK